VPLSVPQSLPESAIGTGRGHYYCSLRGSADIAVRSLRNRTDSQRESGPDLAGDVRRVLVDPISPRAAMSSTPSAHGSAWRCEHRGGAASAAHRVREREQRLRRTAHGRTPCMAALSRAAGASCDVLDPQWPGARPRAAVLEAAVRCSRLALSASSARGHVLRRARAQRQASWAQPSRAAASNGAKGQGPSRRRDRWHGTMDEATFSGPSRTKASSAFTGHPTPQAQL
jgi:hypothetical protein